MENNVEINPYERILIDSIKYDIENAVLYWGVDRERVKQLVQAIIDKM